MSPAMRMQEVTKIIIIGMCEQSADDVEMEGGGEIFFLVGGGGGLFGFIKDRHCS
jgi:hypothetical protein